jgi:hypothetical protein
MRTSAAPQAKAEAADKSTLLHLRAAAGTAAEAQKLSSAALESLSQQAAALAHARAKVDNVEANNDKARHMLRGMGSCWGAMSNWCCYRAPPDVDAVAVSALTSGGGGAAAGGAPAVVSSAADHSSCNATATVAAAALGATGTTADEDALLAAISTSVGRLEEMGRTMGAELAAQDRTIDDLIVSSGHAAAGLEANTKVAEKIASM